MPRSTHPLAKLRQTIRQAGKEYRHSDDNSNSLFHPDQGFTYAYDVSIVENALEAFEAELATGARRPESNKSIEQELIEEAQQIVATNTDMKIRDFARSVAAYLIINKATEKEPKVRLVHNFDELNQEA